MKPAVRIGDLLVIGLWVALASCLATGCVSCRGPAGPAPGPTNGPAISGSITYLPATHQLQVSGGFILSFGKEPPAGVLAALRQGDARPDRSVTNWFLPAVTNQIQERALEAALRAGATIRSSP